MMPEARTHFYVLLFGVWRQTKKAPRAFSDTDSGARSHSQALYLP
jgi:hypothetical protein